MPSFSQMPEIAWPTSFSSLSESMRDAFNVGFATQLGSVDCLVPTTYCDRVLNIMLGYFGFLLGMPLFILVLRYGPCRADPQKVRPRDRAQPMPLPLPMQP